MTTITDPEKMKALVAPFNGQHASGSTYDLRVGAIVAPKPISAVAKFFLRGQQREITNAPGTRIEIPPQGMVWLVSAETLNLPNYVTGHVDLVNGLSRKGLLALNTGVIDPNYSGPISTAVINFSLQSRDICIGERFFRVSFLAHDPVLKNKTSSEPEDYLKNLLAISREFPATFLDLEGLNQEMDRVVTDRINSAVPRFFPMFAFIIAACALLASVVNFLVSSPWFKALLDPPHI